MSVTKLIPLSSVIGQISYYGSPNLIQNLNVGINSDLDLSVSFSLAFLLKTNTIRDQIPRSIIIHDMMKYGNRYKSICIELQTLSSQRITRDLPLSGGVPGIPEI